MSVLVWLILGVIAGFVASRLYVGTGQGIILDIILGIIGAFVGGYVVSFFGGGGVNGINIDSIAVAAVGAVLVLWFYHALTGRPSGP